MCSRKQYLKWIYRLALLGSPAMSHAAIKLDPPMDVGEVDGALAQAPFDEDSELLHSLAEQQNQMERGQFAFQILQVAVEAAPYFPKVLVEVFKVRVDRNGRVIESILGVKDRRGEAKEFILVTLDDELSHAWAVSTAQSYRQRFHKEKRKMVTPFTSEGTDYRPHTLSVAHSSKAYGDGYSVNMPTAIFFNGGIALHGTTPDHFRQLGIKDSGGCIRLHPPNGRTLWRYVNPLNISYVSKTKNSDALAEIQSRVTINVYGFERTGADLRDGLRQKYGPYVPWIQARVQEDLDRITPPKKK